MIRLRDIPIKIVRRLLKVLYFDQNIILYKLSTTQGFEKKVDHSIHVLENVENLFEYSVCKDIRFYLEDMLQKGNICYVAIINSEIVAMAPVSFTDTHVSEINRTFKVENKSAYIFSCYTSQRYEGNGLYQSLLHCITNDMSERIVYIMSLKENYPSRRSIEKLGTKLGEIRLTRYLTQYFRYSVSESVEAYFR